MPTIPDILTVAEVARYMRISRDTVYRLAARGELRGRKVGRIWRFPKSAIEEYVHGNASFQHECLGPQAGGSNARSTGDVTLAPSERAGIAP
ncbi:MAG: helix-turn-helix domain-containing protein [Phycisphaerae bacterium]